MNNTRIFAVTATEFAQGQPDVNGKMSLYLSPFAGEIPRNARVLNGTVAENLGVEAGNSYLIRIEYTGDHEEYGPQFRHMNATKLSASEILDLYAEQAKSNAPWNPGQTQTEVEDFAEVEVEDDVSEESAV